MKTVHEKIKKLREQLKISQEYVAKYLGVSRSTVTQIENGNRRVLAEEIPKLCELFGVSSNAFFEEKDLDQPATIFVLRFDKLDENDQAESINLIRFKEQMKAQRGR